MHPSYIAPAPSCARTQMTFYRRVTPFALVVSALLTGCGGGGGGERAAPISPATETPAAPTPAPASTPQTAGLWQGTTHAGRATHVVMLDDGRFYFLYSTVADTTTMGGSVVGLISNSGQSYTSQLAYDFDWEGMAAQTGTLTGSIDSQAGFNGNMNYTTNADRAFSFTSSLRQPAANVVTLADVAGAYANSDRTMTMDIDEKGGVTGVAFSKKCAFAGTVVPTRNYTSLLQITLSFAGGGCALGASTVEGIAIYNPERKELLGAAVTATGKSVAMFQTRKP